MSKVIREKCTEIIQEFEPSTEAKLLGHLGIDGTHIRMNTNFFLEEINLLQVLLIIFYHRNVIFLIQIIEVFVKKWIIH
jgi:hypothetical protein